MSPAFTPWDKGTVGLMNLLFGSVASVASPLPSERGRGLASRHGTMFRIVPDGSLRIEGYFECPICFSSAAP